MNNFNVLKKIQRLTYKIILIFQQEMKITIRQEFNPLVPNRS